MDMRRRRAVPSPRRLVLTALTVASAVTAAGCSVPPPPGDAPLRYRDVLPGTTVSVTPNVVYSTSQDGTANTLTLDIYRPTPDTPQRPAIVLVHGGGFVSGTSLNGAMVTMANAFAQRGYVAVSINYRLLGDGNCANEDPPSQTCFDAAFAAQHDAQAAVRWLRALCDDLRRRSDPDRDRRRFRRRGDVPCGSGELRGCRR